MSDPAPSTIDIAAIVGGIVSLLAVIGGAVKWLFNRADSKEARLDKRDAAYVIKIEKRLSDLEETQGKLWTCFSLVATALHAKEPGDPALARAAKILGDAFPIDLHTPDDMIGALDRIDRAPRHIEEEHP